MDELNWKGNTLSGLYYRVAAAGFVVLGLGYVMRDMLEVHQGIWGLILGVLPNFLGSLATPFILLLMLAARLKQPAKLKNMGIFTLLNGFTFATALAIEQLHVTFRLGSFDWNDIAASILGGGLAMMMFSVLRQVKAVPAPVG